MTFKITYATSSSPGDEIDTAFQKAAAAARERAGGESPMWIDGEPRESGPRFEDRSPIDRRIVVGRFQSARPKDVADAVDAARRAYAAWSATPWAERIAVLRRAADLISERRFELAALMSLEVGKNRFESLADAEESADLIRYYCHQIEEADGFSRPMGRLADNERTRDVLKPYGVWGVISPFNFPVALAAGMSAGALVAGNTVVFKPASDAAASGLELHRALTDAGLPPGVFNTVTGSGSVIGDELVTNPAVAGLVFTGSKEVGHGLFRRFNERGPRPCYLELGGKNPAIVTAQADLDKAAEGVARAAFGFGGQKCSACSRVYVERAVAGEFKRRLVERAEALTIGDPLEHGIFLGPAIDDAARRRFVRAVAEAEADGRLLTGGEILTGEPFDHGDYVTPTVVEGLAPEHRLLAEELFLPFLCLGETDTLDEAIDLANQTEYGLTAGIYSEKPGEVERFFDRIEAGVTYANRRSGATTGAWPGVNPFCGWKASGSAGKGVCGPYYVAQFLREQSQTVME
jgi:1-pyrroline-5-carboxylate dehydrogenase